MTLTDGATIVVSIATTLSILLGAGRFVVKGWLMELKPNHGSSLHDRVNRIEARVDSIYDHLVTNK